MCISDIQQYCARKDIDDIDGDRSKIAWYTVFHYVMILVSLIVISYIIISRNDNSVGHMIAMIVAVFIGYECYIMPVYIKTAAVLTAASFMLWWYLYQAKEKPFKKTTILAVEFLGILGSLVSWKIFLGTSFMMIVVLFFCFYKKDMNPDLKKLMKKLLPLGIMLGISIMFWAVDYSSYAHRDHWSTTVEYKGAVEKLYAFGIPEYQDIDRGWSQENIGRLTRKPIEKYVREYLVMRKVCLNLCL